MVTVIYWYLRLPVLDLNLAASSILKAAANGFSG